MYEDIIGNSKKKVKVNQVDQNDEEGYATYSVGDQIIRVYKTWLKGYKDSKSNEE